MFKRAVLVFPARGFAVLSVLLIAGVLFPFFIFLFKARALHAPLDGEWVGVLFSTLLQAGLSAGISILLGVWGALGLCAFARVSPNLRAMELFCLLPALLPPLVCVLSWVNTGEWFFRIPFSFYTVLCAHVLMNTGLVAVFFFRLFGSSAVRELSDWAFLHGAGRFLFLKSLLFFELKKDLALIFLLVFSFCFVSFSVPLLVGGGSGQTLEVFIAETLKNPAEWPYALFLFVIETVFLFLFFSLLYGISAKSPAPDLEFGKRLRSVSPLLSLKSALPVVLFPSLLLCLGFAAFLFSYSAWQEVFLIKESVFTAWAGTLLTGLSTGCVSLFLLSLVAFCARSVFLRQFLVAYTGASAAFMGFAFLVMGGDSSLEVLLKWSWGLGLLFLPALYRLMGESVLSRLKEQVALADLMGAGRWMSFARVIWPQCMGAFLFLSGVAAFWACGDFAYSSIVAGDQWTLALLAQDLFASYRFEQAGLITGLLIFTGAGCFLLFAGGAFVLYKKFSLPSGGL